MSRIAGIKTIYMAPAVWQAAQDKAKQLGLKVSTYLSKLVIAHTNAPITRKGRQWVEGERKDGEQ
jgi:hypothetical protein